MWEEHVVLDFNIFFNRPTYLPVSQRLRKLLSLVPRPRFPTAAGGLHHHFPRSGDVIHPQLLGIWVWGRDYKLLI